MRAFGWIVCILLLHLSNLPSVLASQDAVRWQPTLDVAKRVAGQTNRLVLIHFWADWCQPCRKMDRDVFSHPEVADAIEQSFVPVKVHADHFPQTKRLYGVSMLPTDVIITPQGQVVEKMAGSAAEASHYIAGLSRVAADFNAQRSQLYAEWSPTAPTTAMPPATPSRQTLIPPSYSGQQAPADYLSGRVGPHAMGRSPMESTTSRSRPDWPTQPQVSPTGPPYAAQPVPGATGGLPSHVAEYAPAPGQEQAPHPPVLHTRKPDPWQTQSPQAIPPQRTMARPSPPPQGGSAPAMTPSLASRQGPGNSPVPPKSAGGPGNSGDSSPLAGQLPPGSPPLILDGHCPVTLNEQERWVQGDPAWGARHEGRTYLFTGPEQQRRFLENPQRYAPVLAGNDVVLAVEENRTVPGRREYGVWFPDPRSGQVFLFSSEETLHRFHVDTGRYLDGIGSLVGSQAPPAIPPAGGTASGTAAQRHGHSPRSYR